MDFLRFLSNFRNPCFNVLFQGVTWFAQEMIVVAIICWLYWCRNKKLAFTLGYSFFASGMIVQGLKITFRIPRPWDLDSSFSPVESAVSGATGYSFPSGHTQSAGSLYGTLMFHFKKKVLRILFAVIVLLIGFSRMYLGVHTPKDVITALILSLVCSFLSYRFLYRSNSDDAISRASIFLLVITVLLVVYTSILYQRNIIQLSYAQDCFKTAGAGLAFILGYYIERRFIQFLPPKKTSNAVLRFLFGLVIAILLLTLLKPIIGTSLIASLIRYFITILWVLCIYPFIFQKVRFL